ncbi:MAG: DEAD/DEAH box helicase, partial [Polyangiaceae bacterium]|nr:DEAD/DEAH box helicase [Polyangiaceae bacterium]
MHFHPLESTLQNRLANAIVSQMAPRSQALRAHLLNAFTQPPGSGSGALLGDPVFESLFDWRSSGLRLADIPFLHSSLAKELARPYKLPRRGQEFEPLFDGGHYAHQHQYECWQALIEQPGRSALVRTGTASGKTEAFLVPILHDLVSEWRRLHQPLVGVRALFLYPLNALISSQRERLVAGTGHFSNGLRFALYNGLTPEKAEYGVDGPEVIDRRSIRSSPPPMLVTNATMLEYMLVRPRDREILDQSAGKLRWIVLDEAHTYLGSSAAEIALLLRRVLHAFKVEASNVRFVATSATIGGADADENLRDFLADLSGTDRNHISVISGTRHKPDLPPLAPGNAQPLPSKEELAQATDPVKLGERLIQVPVLLELRDRLAEKPQSLSQIAELLKLDADSSLRVVDAMSAADASGTPLLPLRGHHFIRTQPGIWVCLDPQCQGRSAARLDAAEWPFGKVFFDRREYCDACEHLVAELALCNTCGEAYSRVATDAEGNISRAGEEDLTDAETGDWDIPDDEDELAEQPNVDLLCSAAAARGVDGLGRGPYKRLIPRSDGQHSERLVYVADRATRSLRCGHCAALDRNNVPLVRRPILGTGFLGQSALPSVAESVPTLTTIDSVAPAQGRRLITFTDSRQGTARHAVGGQLQAERLWTRAWVVHFLRDEERRMSGSTEEPEAIRDARRSLAEIEAVTAPSLEGIKARFRRQIEEYEASKNAEVRVSWRRVVQSMSTEAVVERWMMASLKRRYAPANLDAGELARVCLGRELLRRPKRHLSLETMGFIRLAYPGIT